MNTQQQSISQEVSPVSVNPEPPPTIGTSIGYLIFGLIFTGVFLFLVMGVVGAWISGAEMSPGFSILGGVSFLFTLLGLYILFGSGRIALRAWRLNRAGHITVGTVTHVWRTTDSDGDDAWGCVAFRFTPSGLDLAGQPITHAERNESAYKTLQVGDEVSVRYLPGNPAVCRLEL